MQSVCLKGDVFTQSPHTNSQNCNKGINYKKNHTVANDDYLFLTYTDVYQHLVKQEAVDLLWQHI